MTVAPTKQDVNELERSAAMKAGKKLERAARPIWQWLVFWPSVFAFFYGLSYGYKTFKPYVDNLDNPIWLNVWLVVYSLLVSGPSPLNIPFTYCLLMYRETWWTMLMDFAGEEKLMAEFWIPLAIAYGVYWINGGILFFIDLTGLGDKWRIQQHRLHSWSQGEDHETHKWDMKKLTKLVKVVGFNQLGLMSPFVYLLYRCNVFTADRNAPGAFEVLYVVTFFSLANEFLFYYGHRLLHHGKWYAKIHKVHHEFKAPIGLAAIYCHPIEMVLSNLIPLFGCLPFVECHGCTVIIWAILAVLGTQTHHSGYDWPWMAWDDQPNFHDFHHEKFQVNYGNIGVLDWFHNTNHLWVKYQAEKTAAKTKTS